MVAADRIPLTEEQVRNARRGYYGAISLVDDHVGAILGTLDEHGLADETIVIVTSDHGDMLGERGLWYKMAPFEDSIRVPLLVHAPWKLAPRRVDDPVSHLDLLPTLVGLAGGPDEDAPTGLDGIDLTAALEGDRVLMRDLPLEYLAEGVRAPQVTLVRGPLKLVRDEGTDRVYDLEADPGEREPLPDDDRTDSLVQAADARWDLERLDAAVRASQQARRLVARALATGTLTSWDHPTLEPDGPYIRSGQDFWSRLERARRV